MSIPDNSHAFGIRVPESVPRFFCPSCEVPMEYQWSGASDSPEGLVDFSDYYSCPAGCGMFEYERQRHRLRLARVGYGAGGATT